MAEKSFWGTVGAIATALTAVVGTVTAVKECSKKEPEAPHSAFVTDNQNNRTQGDIAKQQEQMQRQLDSLKRLINSGSSNSVGNPATTASQMTTVNIVGRWSDRNSGAYYIFGQNGSNITFEEHSVVFGVDAVSAVGGGSISGRNININYTTAFNTSGICTMTIAEDGSSLSGSINDFTSGTTIPLFLIR